MMKPNIFLGMTILSNPLATQTEIKFEVQRWGTREKKRKRWCVVKYTNTVPGCWKVGPNTLVMHPALIEKLQKEFGADFAQMI